MTGRPREPSAMPFLVKNLIVSQLSAEPHPEKGGVRLTQYLTYNSLSISESGQEDMYMASLRTFWTCDLCGLHLPLTFQEKAEHRRVTSFKKYFFRRHFSVIQKRI